MTRQTLRALGAGLLASGLLGAAILAGSRNLAHFDAALVGYTFATLFAAFGITYRYARWLDRPPTRLYWVRGWQAFLTPRRWPRQALLFAGRLLDSFAAQRFILARGGGRWAAHLLIAWGCLIAAAVTFPLVFGWIQFETAPEAMGVYRTLLFGFPVFDFRLGTVWSWLIFHLLAISALMVLMGCALAFHRRLTDRGARATEGFEVDLLPLLLLFAIALTGLLLTVSYTWLHGYLYEFLAVTHAVVVIVTLLYLPFGKFFHIFQRPAQLGVSFYRDAAREAGMLACARCGQEFAPARQIGDLETVEAELGFSYRIETGPGAEAVHYQRICPACRRKLFALTHARAVRARGRPAEPAISLPESK